MESEWIREFYLLLNSPQQKLIEIVKSCACDQLVIKIGYSILLTLYFATVC